MKIYTLNLNSNKNSKSNIFKSSYNYKFNLNLKLQMLFKTYLKSHYIINIAFITLFLLN